MLSMVDWMVEVFSLDMFEVIVCFGFYEVVVDFCCRLVVMFVCEDPVLYGMKKERESVWGKLNII